MTQKHAQPHDDEWVTFPGGELEGKRPKVLCAACRDQLKRVAASARYKGDARPREHAARTLCFQVDCSEHGEIVDAERLFFILNGHYETQAVKLPQPGASKAWFRAVDTSLPSGPDFADEGQEVRIDPPGFYIANPRTTVVLLAR